MAVLATAFYYIAFAKGTALLLSSVAGMLSGAIPLFSFVTALAFLRQEPINVRSVGGTPLGFLGILLIARRWSQNIGGVDIDGVLWMVAGSFSVGCSFVYARKIHKSARALAVDHLSNRLCPRDPAGDGRSPRHRRGLRRHPRRARAGGGTGPLRDRLAYIFYYLIVDRLGAVAASGVTYIPPVVALVIGIVLAGEPVRGLDASATAGNEGTDSVGGTKCSVATGQCRALGATRRALLLLIANS
jgi:drug/metabolite transporter (DMT)-like permease